MSGFRREPLSRRHVLRGLLGGVGVSLALPPLEAMFNATGTAYACDGILPLRFGLYFWGNGNLPERWTPVDEGFGYTLSEQLAPLAPVQDLVTVVTGLSCKVPNIVPHGSGVAGILSGQAMADDETFTAPSIDQLIAAGIGDDSIYRSLQTSPSGASGQSWNSGTSRNPPESDPWLFFDRVFGATFREPGEEGLVDPRLGLRRSVLDAVMEDVAALQSRVGAADQQRLEQHLEGIRELELRLARLQEDPPDLESCARADEPEASYPDIEGRPQLSEKSRVFSDMLAMTLACDQTRVFGHYFSDPVNNLLFEGASAGHHDLTHNEPDPQDEVNDITVQVIEEFAYLVQALDAVPEGDGTLLDNCVLLATSECSAGRTHSLDEMPVLVSGSGCGTLVQGEHVRTLGGENANKLLLSLIRATGILQSSLGTDEAYTEDGLSGIEL